MKRIFSMLSLMLILTISVVAQSVSYSANIRSDVNANADSFLDTLTAVETHFFVVDRVFSKTSDIIFTINTVENIAATFTGTVIIQAKYSNDDSVPWQDADDLEVVSGTVDAPAVQGNAQSFQVEGAVGRIYRLSVLNSTATTNVITVGVRIMD